MISKIDIGNGKIHLAENKIFTFEQHQVRVTLRLEILISVFFFIGESHKFIVINYPVILKRNKSYMQEWQRQRFLK